MGDVLIPKLSGRIGAAIGGLLPGASASIA
jgi:hypothetical protein